MPQRGHGDTPFHLADGHAQLRLRLFDILLRRARLRTPKDGATPFE